MVGWVSQKFISSGSFVVPAGVYQILTEGCGGGGGAGSGAPGVTAAGTSAMGGGGGGGSIKRQFWIPVTPGNTLTITIGAGGAGGVAAPGGPRNGHDGYDSTITNGASLLANFPGAQAGLGDKNAKFTPSFGSYSMPGSNMGGASSILAGTVFANNATSLIDESRNLSVTGSVNSIFTAYISTHGFGGPGSSLTGVAGSKSLDGYSGGTGAAFGAISGGGTQFGGGGGGGGGGGPYGIGGNAGAGAAGLDVGAGNTGNVGSAASANTGGGGGGGGGGGSSSTSGGTGGNGGAGGSGLIIVYYLQ